VLEQYIREKLKQKDILLMTHIVLGYPSFEDSMRLVETMVEAGVDLIELQIPFSEPQADGPVIVAANQQALAAGSSVARCVEFAREVSARFPIPFLFMSYYNIFYKYGPDAFTALAKDAGIRGAIVPDVPIEEGEDYLAAMGKSGLDPIFIYAPNSTLERMQAISAHASGFVYCVARKGVTGEQTQFSRDLADYLARCRKATTLPLALGFGVSEKADVDYLRGKADIAVIGSQALRIMDQQGIPAVGDFLRSVQ